MNDTILTTRQSKILDLLKNNKELTRLQISSMLISDKPISRITLIRELNKLVDNGHIIQQGKARATTYR